MEKITQAFESCAGWKEADGTYSYRFITFNSRRSSSITLLGGHIWLGCEFCPLSLLVCLLKSLQWFLPSFLGYFTLSATLQGLSTNISLKVFLSKDSPSLRNVWLLWNSKVMMCQKHRTSKRRDRNSLSSAARARTSARFGGQHGSELWNAATTLWPLEQCLDCRTPGRSWRIRGPQAEDLRRLFSATVLLLF